MSTSASSPLRVDFIDPAQHQLPGRLGLTIAPGKRDDRWQRDLTVDLQRLRAEYDTGLLVSLMEPFEYRLLHIEGLFEAAQALGIRVARFPIVDVSVPPPSALPEFAALIWQVVDAMRGSRTVVVHCRGGKGRSGVVAACALVALGAEPNAAIAAVRRARPRAVETRAQEQWVSAFREHLAANPARSTTTQKAGSDGAPTEIILSHNSGSDQRPGVAGAAQGNFLAVPPDLSTHELSWLAHLLNGYEIAEQHLGTTCDVVRDRLIEHFRADGRWAGSALELLAGFFMLVRGWRWQWDFPADNSESHLEALGVFHALQERLREVPGEVVFVPRGE